MKKLFYIVLPLFLVFSFVSCSSFVNEKTGSLTIQFNAEDFKAAKARAADTTGFTDGYLISLNISGGYDYSEIIDLSSDTTYSATFNSISVGSDIKVDVNVFNPKQITDDDDRKGEGFYHICQGSSSTTIKSGINIIEIPLKGLLDCKRDADTPDYYSFSVYTDPGYAPTIYFFKNGKYQIYITEGWGDEKRHLVCSEGTWEGNFSVMENGGGSIKLKEYIYLNHEPTDDFPQLPTNGNESFTIVKKPKVQSINFFQNEDEIMLDSIDAIISDNGVTYYPEP